MPKDQVKNGYVYHPVKKIWNGIVSIGSYTFDKCLRMKCGIVIFYKNPNGSVDQMSIPFEELTGKSFQLHKKTIPSKFGKPYHMYDFGWRPQEKDVNGINGLSLSEAVVEEAEEIPSKVFDGIPDLFA